MATYLNYFIESNIGIFVLVVTYQTLFRKETYFGFKRLFLLVGTLLTLAFPLVNIENNPTSTVPLKELITYSSLPNTEITASTSPPKENISLPLMDAGHYLYMAVCMLLLFLLLFKILKLIVLIRSNPAHVYKERYIIVDINKPAPAFSFFNYIFISHAFTFTAEEKAHIIGHEMAHVDYLHTMDRLFIEIVKCIFWINPLVYILQKEIIQLHEFQADNKILFKANPDEYCNLLAKITIQTVPNQLAHHFYQSLTLKRIAMIKTSKSKIKAWKVAVILPIVACLFFVVACQDQVMKENLENNKTLSQVSEYPVEVQAEIAKLQVKNPKARFTYVEGEPKEVKSTLEKAKESQIVIRSFDFKKRGVTGILLSDMSNFAENMKIGDEIFQVVEEPASPEGGFPVFSEFIQTHIQYPAEARQKNIQGKVYVSFVVQKDGSLSNFEVLRGIGSGCDQEALRVLQNSPRWKPGKQRGRVVKQKISIPVNFSLNNEAISDASQETIDTSMPNPTPAPSDQMNIATKKVMKNGVAYLEGTVKDANGNPIAGTNVVFKGANLGTITDKNGYFSIAPKTSQGSFVFSYAGYKTVELVYVF